MNKDTRIYTNFDFLQEHCGFDSMPTDYTAPIDNGLAKGAIHALKTDWDTKIAQAAEIAALLATPLHPPTAGLPYHARSQFTRHHQLGS